MNGRKTRDMLYHTQGNFGGINTFEKVRYNSQYNSPKAADMALLKDNPGSGHMA